MSRAVLDSSALLAYVLAEPGAGAVKEYIGNSSMSAVNLSEVVARLMNAGASEELIRGQFKSLGLTIVDFGEETAYAAGKLRERTKDHGLSLGDRVCIATAARLGLPAVTADRQWAELDVDVEIVLIRGPGTG